MALWVGTCEDTLQSDIYTKQLHDVSFMLCDIGAICCSLLADKLGIQRVDISLGFSDPFLSIIHNFPASIAHIPQMPFWLPKKLSFLGRVQNFLLYGLGYLMFKTYLTGPYSNLWKHYVPDSQFQNIEELFRSTGILLIPTDFAITRPRTLAPHMKVIGLILPEPAKPLPSNVQEFISNSRHDNVIYVSFGTVISNFADDFIETLASALSSLPATVLWKHKGKMPSKVGGNVKILPWFPQNDILGDPSTKLFITHGGLNSVSEASFHGVPMVLVPIFGDQFDNGLTIENFGIGLVINFKDITSEKIIKTVNKVINDDSFTTKAKQVASQIVYPGRKVTKPNGYTYTQPLMRTPTQQAADWLEYGLHNDAGLHLRSESDKLSFVQEYMIDVIVFITVCLLLLFKVLFVVVTCVVRWCCSCVRRHKSKSD